MHTRHAQMEGVGDIRTRVSHHRTQQDVGTSHPTRRRFAFVDHVEQVSPLLFGKVNQNICGLWGFLLLIPP